MKMNMFEEAAAIKTMQEMRSLTRAQIAEMLGVSISYVANKLRLLGLEKDLQSKIIENNLSERHARALLRADVSARKRILNQICERGLNVAESEALIDMQFSADFPKRMSRAEGLESVDLFVSAVRSGVNTLCAKGVEASCRTTYIGDKLTLIISINEG